MQAGSDDMIKVIASDMDGTLLNSEHTISKRTYDIIQKVQRAGIRFMIATGGISVGVGYIEEISALL